MSKTCCRRSRLRPSAGLEATTAKERLEEVGPNRLPEPEKDPAWKRFLAQFTDPLVLTLLAAAVVAVIVGISGGEAPDQGWLSRFADAIAIVLIVLLNAIIGFYQEARAEQALEALEKLTAPSARVRRDGQLMEIESAFLVPGDILELEAGGTPSRPMPASCTRWTWRPRSRR